MKKVIIGADEAGRGCIAGSIFGAAVSFLYSSIDDIPYIDLIKDSKKIKTYEKREEIAYKIMMDHNVVWSVYNLNADFINKRGIGMANRIVFIKSIENLIYKLNNRNIYDFDVYIDGNLKISLNYYPEIKVSSIIKGDSKIIEISAASIIAKHFKDKENKLLYQNYPQYSFLKHSGYDTELHRKEIIKYGIIKGVHRTSYKTFNKIFENKPKLFYNLK